MFSEKQEPLLPRSISPRPSSRPSYVKEILCLLGAIVLTAQLAFLLQHCYAGTVGNLLVKGAANSTLGFGAIYAVSRKGSPRREALLRAAQLTGLDISIPLQPSWTDEDVDHVKANENSNLNKGSAMAWLGHLNAIERFLKSDESTALIMEDDVDWDTRLRSEQIPGAAYAIRELLGSKTEGYYGNPNKWDIIWLGHCGDYFNASQGANITEIKSFTDPHMPKFEELHPWTQEFLDEIGANDDGQRLVHPSVQPLCTFAYAITRSAAERLRSEAAKEPSRASANPCRAFDVRLMEACRDDGFRCISVNPELFHHADLMSEIAEVTSDNAAAEAESGNQPAVEAKTTNIKCSARSQKWNDLRARLARPGVDPDLAVRELAEASSHCYIDDL